VNGFSPLFVGYGPSLQSAREDWEERVHCEFQRLYGIPEWQMEAADKRKWQTLKMWIDTDAYRNTTSLFARELGKVMSMDPGRMKIRWNNGRQERFQLDQTPGPFAAYKPGTWFDATVEREPQTGKLCRIWHSQRIPPLDAIAPPDIEQAIKARPTSALPEGSL
jgi:hypothetical protein